MEQGYARITVCFEAPFWIGVLEREWGGTLEVCKIVFGAEPRDYEVYAFLMSHWRELRFSPPVTGVRRAEAANPKRARREGGAAAPWWSRDQGPAGDRAPAGAEQTEAAGGPPQTG